MKLKLFALLFVFMIGFVATPVRAQQSGAPGANYETRLSALEEALREMNGRVEQLEYSIRRSDIVLQKMQMDIDARIQRLEAAAAQAQAQPPMPPPQAQSPPYSQNAGENAAPNPDGTLGNLKMQNGKITGGTVNPKAPPLPDTPSDYGLTTQEQYDQAFGLLRQADYEGAGGAFKSFIEKNPKDKLIDNAKYWYAETLYVRAKFDEAAVAFGDAWQQNPQGAKAPDSLLKLGMSLAANNKTKDACTSLAELGSKYPNAPAAVRQRASEERTKLKCPGR